MNHYKGLPLVSLDIVDEKMDGVQIISLVDYPAIEREFVAFSEQEEVRLSINDERRIVTGPALVPDQKIFRRNEETGEKYYITFSKEAIERIAQKFFADRNSTNVNLEHQFEVGDCVFFESYLIDKERGICPKEYSDLPDGTWMVSCKINNDDVWKLVKDGTLRGFSIEGNLHRAEEKPIDSVEELIKKLKNN